MEFRMDGAREILQRTSGVETLLKQVETIEEAVSSSPGLAFDLAKSLIETTCKTILGDLGLNIKGSPDCPKILKQTLSGLRIVPDSHDEASKAKTGLKEVANGISTIVNGLCALRNSEGLASHGRDAFLTPLQPAQAFLAARAADAIVGFLWSIHKENPVSIVPSRLLYEDNLMFNEWIDSQYESPIEIMGTTFAQSELLFKADRIAYHAKLIEFTQELRAQSQENQNEEAEDLEL